MPVDVVMFDQDKGALAYAYRRIQPLTENRQGPAVRILYLHESIKRLLHDRTLFDEFGAFDLIYSAGLFDYLRVPIQTLKVGSLGTHNCLGLAKAKGARILLASTSEVYGDPLVHPQREDYWGNVNPIGPRGVYDEAKRYAEAMTLAYHRAHQLDTRIVRIFNTYGPRMALEDGRAVPNFIGQALRGRPLTIHGDGSQTRSFTYISDLVNGITRLLDSDEIMPVNIGNPNEMTIKAFAEKINAATGNQAGIIYTEAMVDDPRQRCPDITRARTLLHWEPQVDVDTGLQATIEFFRQKMAGNK